MEIAGQLSPWHGGHLFGAIVRGAFVPGAIGRSPTSLYHTLVRSNLEYCSSVWSPSTVSDTKVIESIQSAATRYILYYPEIEYDKRCTMLHLHPLSYRREITDLLYVFKCSKGYYDVSWYNNEYFRTHLWDLAMRALFYVWKLLEQSVLK